MNCMKRSATRTNLEVQYNVGRGAKTKTSAVCSSIFIANFTSYLVQYLR
ncbi:unnamed protein product, partial [Allacma fusca]